MSWLLSGFAKRKSLAIKRYIKFVKYGKNQPSPWDELTNQVFLGSESFENKVQTHIPENQDLSEIVIA